MRAKAGFKLIGATLLAAVSCNVHAADSKVNVGTPLPRLALLKEGAHHYLRFMKSGDSSTPIDIWTREIRFEKGGSQQLMQIKQRWDAVNPPSIRQLNPWFEAGTFRPRTHERISERNGKRVVEGFAFAPDKVTGLKDLANNTQKDMAVDSPEPTYNFGTDIEFLQALPLAAGYEANINFYHPGGSVTSPSHALVNLRAATDLLIVFNLYLS